MAKRGNEDSFPAFIPFSAPATAPNHHEGGAAGAKYWRKKQCKALRSLPSKMSTITFQNDPDSPRAHLCANKKLLAMRTTIITRSCCPLPNNGPGNGQRILLTFLLFCLTLYGTAAFGQTATTAVPAHSIRGVVTDAGLNLQST